jgi:hypothetical protein
VKMGGEEEKWKGQRILRRSVGDWADEMEWGRLDEEIWREKQIVKCRENVEASQKLKEISTICSSVAVAHHFRVSSIFWRNGKSLRRAWAGSENRRTWFFRSNFQQVIGTDGKQANRPIIVNLEQLVATPSLRTCTVSPTDHESPGLHILQLVEWYSQRRWVTEPGSDQWMSDNRFSRTFWLALSRWDEWSGTITCRSLMHKEKPLALIPFSLQLSGIRNWNSWLNEDYFVLPRVKVINLEMCCRGR